MPDTVDEKDPIAELRALRERREKILQLQAKCSSVATAAKELLAQTSTWPRTRAEVEAELTTAERFDLPMLAHELVMVDQAIAKLEASLQPEPPLAILAAAKGPPGAARKRRRLRRLLTQREQSVERLSKVRLEFEAAVSAMQDLSGPRERLQQAIKEVEKLDYDIDRLGAEVKRTAVSTPSPRAW